MSADPDDVRAQLERILSSADFSTAHRHSRLLRYLVERTLAGEGEQLKEYVLGTEVFDRAESFDPRLDSIVRVEVRRLRSRLEEYYRERGASDPLIITIPTGTYVPNFANRSPASAPNVPGVHRDRPPWAVIALGAALIVAVVLLAVGVALNSTRTPARASSAPSVAVLPFEHYSTRDEESRLVAQITDMVTAELAKIDRVAVASRTSAARITADRSVPDIARTLDVDYVMESSVIITGETLHLVVRLVDGRLDRKVWVGEYDARPASILETSRRIASDAAAALWARR
jgi:TolB-like protein